MNLPAQNFASDTTFCSNPYCNEPYDLDKATSEVQKSGIVYADCGEVIFQGYKCPNPNCRGIRFVSCDRSNPAFDLRGFIIIPNLHHYANKIEQFRAYNNSDGEHDFLKFHFITAWDESVPIQSFPENYFNRAAYDSCCMIPEEYEFEEPEDVEILPEELASEMTDGLMDASMIPLIIEHQRSTMGIPYLMATDQFERRRKRNLKLVSLFFPQKSKGRLYGFSDFFDSDFYRKLSSTMG